MDPDSCFEISSLRESAIAIASIASIKRISSNISSTATAFHVRFLCRWGRNAISPVATVDEISAVVEIAVAEGAVVEEAVAEEAVAEEAVAEEAVVEEAVVEEAVVEEVWLFKAFAAFFSLAVWPVLTVPAAPIPISLSVASSIADVKRLSSQTTWF
jgi:hypothetical protein